MKDRSVSKGESCVLTRSAGNPIEAWGRYRRRGSVVVECEGGDRPLCTDPGVLQQINRGKTEARATSVFTAAHKQWSDEDRDETKRVRESKRELKVKGRKEREDWFISNPSSSTSIRLSVPASTSTIQSEHQE